MRSKRFEALDARPVKKDGFVTEWPEVGLIAMNSELDPKPSIKVENGVIVEMDGKTRDEFDMLDQFIADYAIHIDDGDLLAFEQREIAVLIVKHSRLIHFHVLLLMDSP